MTEAARSAVVIGAGVFGVTGALALRRRGWRVTLLDSGPLPHVRASSTDLCKVVRMDYGADDLFTDLAAEAMIGWDRWNASWPEPLYCETGFALMAGGAMVPGSFEHESFTRMQARDVPVERIDGDALCARFPVWVATGLTDGYFNPRAGWAASGRVMERLIAEARAGGVAIHAGKQLGRERGSRVVGVEMARGGGRVDTPSLAAPAGCHVGHRPAARLSAPEAYRRLPTAALLLLGRRHHAHGLVWLPGRGQRHREDRQSRRGRSRAPR
jgi:glycine/D-amino acid oxidase-like deaminating enzyme